MIVGEIVAWLTDPASWQGEDGIWMQVLRHLAYSFAALALACLVAVPLGLWIGHTGKGSVVAVNLAGALRALPSLGLLLTLDDAPLRLDDGSLVLVNRGFVPPDRRDPATRAEAMSLMLGGRS